MDYGRDTELQKCIHWSTTTMRTVFFIIGVFGEWAVLVGVNLTVTLPLCRPCSPLQRIFSIFQEPRQQVIGDVGGVQSTDCHS